MRYGAGDGNRTLRLTFARRLNLRWIGLWTPSKTVQNGATGRVEIRFVRTMESDSVDPISEVLANFEKDPVGRIAKECLEMTLDATPQFWQCTIQTQNQIDLLGIRRLVHGITHIRGNRLPEWSKRC